MSRGKGLRTSVSCLYLMVFFCVESAHDCYVVIYLKTATWMSVGWREFAQLLHNLKTVIS